MESELGKQLFIRGNRKVTLSDEVVAGDIRVGTGETQAVRFLIRVAQQLQSEYPLVRFHVSSEDGLCVVEELDSGFVDFGLVFGMVDTSKYDCLEIPYEDTWGVLMRKDAPLAKKSSISPEDLWDKPLIISRHMGTSAEVQKWLKRGIERLNINTTYSLLYNGSLMVDEGRGYVLCIDKIINTDDGGELMFSAP